MPRVYSRYTHQLVYCYGFGISTVKTIITRVSSLEEQGRTE